MAQPLDNHHQYNLKNACPTPTQLFPILIFFSRLAMVSSSQSPVLTIRSLVYEVWTVCPPSTLWMPFCYSHLVILLTDSKDNKLQLWHVACAFFDPTRFQEMMPSWLCQPHSSVHLATLSYSSTAVANLTEILPPAEGAGQAKELNEEWCKVQIHYQPRLLKVYWKTLTS